MEIQPQLVLLEKTLVNIEGLGRQLYPELDLWQTGQPVLREWMAERTGPRALSRQVRQDLPEIHYALERLPQALGRFVDQMLEEERHEPTRPDRRTVHRWAKRRYLLATGSVMLIGASILIGLDAEPMELGWGLGVCALLLLFMGRPRP